LLYLRQSARTSKSIGGRAAMSSGMWVMRYFEHASNHSRVPQVLHKKPKQEAWTEINIRFSFGSKMELCNRMTCPRPVS
jgi:hypothetical protein